MFILGDGKRALHETTSQVLHALLPVIIIHRQAVVCLFTCQVYPSIISLDSDNSHLQAMSMRAGFRTGRWRGRRVLLVEQYVLSRAVNLRMRRAIIWMRDQVRHANISEFYGLLLQDGLYSTVSNYCSKGDLQNLLHGTR